VQTTTLDALCAAALTCDPNNQAINFEQRWFSWGEMREVAERLTQLIDAAGSGTVKVAFMARNRPSALAAFLGLLSRRCAIRMLYPFQSPELIARELENISPDFFVAAEEDYSETLLVALKQKRISAAALSEMDARSILSFERRENKGDIPCALTILTSGTTGTPKEFSLSYEMIVKHIVGQVSRNVEGHSSLPPVILMFPVSNISGLYSTLPALLKGQRVVLLDRFTVAGWRDYVVRYRPQMTGLPPAGIQMLLDAAVSKDDLKSLQAIGTGAAPLPPAIHRAFEERYGIPILLSYGATEFGGPVAAMTLDLQKIWGNKKFGSVGKAMVGVSLRVVDATDGSALAAGSEGILEVISPRIGPQWIRTSDVAVIDEDGFLFMIGRADGAIMRGGFKLLPATIEHALLLHPAVSTVAVVGLKDRRLGEIPVAAVELKQDAKEISVRELEEHLRRHIAATHIPARWCLVKSLPRTTSMKIDQMAVRKLFDDEVATTI